MLQNVTCSVKWDTESLGLVADPGGPGCPDTRPFV